MSTPRDDGPPPPPETLDADVYGEYIADHEERLAERRRSAIEAGRRKGGVAGAAMAGAMLGMRDIIEGPPKDDAPVTVEASGDPLDLDKDGLDISVGDVDVAAPALARIEPITKRRRGRAR